MATQFFLRRIDSRYCIPNDIEVLRVVAEQYVEDGDYWVFVCVVREVLP